MKKEEMIKIGACIITGLVTAGFIFWENRADRPRYKLSKAETKRERRDQEKLRGHLEEITEILGLKVFQTMTVEDLEELGEITSDKKLKKLIKEYIDLQKEVSARDLERLGIRKR